MDVQSNFTGGATALGIGGSIFSALESSSAAGNIYKSQQQVAQLEMQADQQRRQAMEISARRQMLQNVRTAQQARSTALATAVGSGAQFSSSAESGQAQAVSGAAYNNQGIMANLQIGENLFNINSQIDEQKMVEAKYQSQLSTDQGIGSIFGAIGSQAGNIGKLATLIPGL